jgi:hypothetical protein
MLIASEMRKRPQFSLLSEDNAVGPASQDLRASGARDLQNAIVQSVFWANTFLLQKAQAKVCELANLKSNWDTYGAPAPSSAALENAIRILDLMPPFDVALANIVPSAEGGIGFCFANGERYADIESSNDGQILGVRYAGMDTPVLIQIDGTDDSIKEALAQVRHHIRG